MASRGEIKVSENEIFVIVWHDDSNDIFSGFSSCSYKSVTVENITDAARVLAKWIDARHENIADECRRVHENDQWDAAIREKLNDIIEENQ